MIITSIRITGSNFQCIEPNNRISAIVGHTGAKKTLLYKLILFVLGVQVQLDINSVFNNFPNASYIELVIKNDEKETIVKKELSESFHAFIGEKEFTNARNYNSEINKLFNLCAVKVENGTKSCEFGFKELLNFVFIPEEQLSSNKSIFTREGFSEKEKIMNFFRYIVSGKTIGNDETKERTSLKKDKNSVKSFQTALNRRVQKPSAKDIKQREKIIDELNQLRENNERLNTELQDLTFQRKQFLITLERINSLYKTYLANIEEAKAGISFEASINMNSEPSDMDVLYLNSLENEISDLGKTIQYSNNKLKKIDESISKINADLTSSKEKEELLLKELESYAYIDRYETVQSASAQIFEVIESKENEVQEKIEVQQKRIDDTYNEKLKELCGSISSRLENWGLHNVGVSFDALNADFRFNKEKLSIIPKGLKSIYSLASALEILKLSVNNNISNLNTIIVDSLWVATDIEGITKADLVNSIVSDLITDGIQVIIFENEIPLSERDGLHIINV